MSGLLATQVHPKAEAFRRVAGLVALSVALVLAPLGAGEAPASTFPQGHEAEQAHGEEGEEEAGWARAYGRYINFGLLLALLYWLLVIPPAFVQDLFNFDGLRVILKRRSGEILAAKETAEQQKAEASRRVEQSETRLSKVEEEVADLLERARAGAEKDKVRREEEARLQAEKVLEMARRELGGEVRNANRQLRSHVAELAVGMAERVLKEQLSQADQERLVQAYLSRLGEQVG